VPIRLRSDNLSAATHELKEGGRTLTKRVGAAVETAIQEHCVRTLDFA
jgi:hypothetical protein